MIPYAEFTCLTNGLTHVSLTTMKNVFTKDGFSHYNTWPFAFQYAAYCSPKDGLLRNCTYITDNQILTKQTKSHH